MNDQIDEAVEMLRQKYPGQLCLTITQLAETSQYHPETIRRWCEDKSIRTRRRTLPREPWRIPLRDAAYFLIEGRRKPTKRKAA